MSSVKIEVKMDIGLDPNHKPYLVMLSGWGVSPRIFDSWISHLSTRFDVHCLDIPDLHLNCLLTAQERAEKLLSQAPEKAYWLGWSLGGAIVTDLAHIAPDRVLGVITLATNPCFEQQIDWPGMDNDHFAQFKLGYQNTPIKTLQRFAALQLSGSTDPRCQLKILKSALLEPQTVLSDMLNLLAEDRRDLYESFCQSVNVPVLALFADSDALVPSSVVPLMKSKFLSVRTERVSSSSHLLFQDQPDVCAKYIFDWLAEVESQYA